MNNSGLKTLEFAANARKLLNLTGFLTEGLFINEKWFYFYIKIFKKVNAFRNYFQSIELKGNVYLTSFINIFIVYILYTLCRIGFYMFNTGFFPGVTTNEIFTMLAGGLKFDTSAVLYTNLLYLFLVFLPFVIRYNKYYQSFLKYLFIVTNSIALAANCADFIYFRFTLRRTTATLFREFGHETNISKMITQFLADYWYIFIIWIVLTAVLVIFYKKAFLKKQVKGFMAHFVYLLNGLVLFALLFGLMVAGMRGGFRHSTRPITLSNAGEFVKDPMETAIVLNTPFSIIRTLRIKPLPQVMYFENEEELNKIYSPVHQPSAKEEFIPLNIVILILESFGREYIGNYNKYLQKTGYSGYTPYLDSLMEHSLVFRYSFSNGRKSIDALPSIFSSIPMMVEPFVLTPYSSNKTNSIASLLNKKGYHTSFFHGAPNGSMGFLSFTKVAGFIEYYGMTDYGNSKDFDGMWGVWDEEFFQFFSSKLQQFPQPFCSAIFSVSSHHPFKIPERYNGVFPKGEHPIHEGVGYTDFVLRKFFNSIKDLPWFNNTLFVITADHPNLSFFPEYKTSLGSFAVPIIFYKPDGSLKEFRWEAAQQIDILPSILGYLNYDEPFVAFGRNLFNSKSNPFTISYTNSSYQLIIEDLMMVSDGHQPTALFKYKSDSLLSNNIIDAHPDKLAKMELFLKAFIQQYNHRMINNMLIIPE